MTMNLYEIISKNELTWSSYSELEPDEYGHGYNMVVAESRSKAWAIVYQNWESTGAWGIEYTEPVSIRLLARDVDLPAGITAENWETVGRYLQPDVALRIFGPEDYR